MSSVDIVTLLKFSHIEEIKRTCDLIMLTIVGKDNSFLALHAECFFRVYTSQNTLICSEFMYRKGRNSKRRFKWSKPGSSFFDDCVNDFKNMIYGINIVDVNLFDDELRLKLDNGVSIEIIPNSPKDEEAYRLFDDKNEYLIV